MKTLLSGHCLATVRPLSGVRTTFLLVRLGDKAHGGDYEDSQCKGYGLTLVVAESTGAVNGEYDRLLRRLSRLSREPGTADYTQYGVSRASPRDFYSHHLVAHSAAVVFADVTTILDDAANKSFWLSRGTAL